MARVEAGERRLILMRHAKSSWAEAGQPDHDRPLNGRGRRAAAAIGGWLVDRGWLPDIALVSTARRTRETFAGLGPAFAALPTDMRDDLYHASTAQLLRSLRAAPDAGCLLMLGHAPGIGAFARLMLGAPPADPAFAKYPTAAVTLLGFDASWDAVQPGEGRLVAFVTPSGLVAPDA